MCFFSNRARNTQASWKIDVTSQDKQQRNKKKNYNNFLLLNAIERQPRNWWRWENHAIAGNVQYYVYVFCVKYTINEELATITAIHSASSAWKLRLTSVLVGWVAAVCNIVYTQCCAERWNEVSLCGKWKAHRKRNDNDVIYLCSREKSIRM